MRDETVRDYAKRIFKDTNDEQFILFFTELNKLREEEINSSSSLNKDDIIEDFDIDEFCRYLKDVLFEIRKQRKKKIN